MVRARDRMRGSSRHSGRTERVVAKAEEHRGSQLRSFGRMERTRHRIKTNIERARLWSDDRLGARSPGPTCFAERS